MCVMSTRGDDDPVMIVGELEESTRVALDDGYATTSVATAADCLDSLEADDVAAVVTDHPLPDGTGLELVEAIRDRHPGLPIVLYPRDGSEQLAGDALAAGASGYVPRDDGPETLLERLADAVAGDGILGEEAGRYRNLVETSPAPINIFDADGETVWGNDAVVELLGLEDRSALVGRSIFEFIHPEDREIARGELRNIVEEGVSTGPTYMRLVRADGEVRHVRIATAPGRYRGERIGQAVAVDVTPLRHHERRLERLNEMLNECIEAETKASVCDAFVRAAADDLDLPVVSIALLEPERGELRPTARTDAAGRALNETALLDEASGAAWAAFATGDPVVLDRSDDGDVDALAIQPLGRHGVLLAGIDPTEEDFVELLAGNVRGMFDRIERESILQEREARLAEQNEMLGRLDRINRVIRRIDAELVGATTRAEIDAAVCRELVDPDLFTFAWIGDYEPSTDRIVPRHAAGEGRGYHDAVTVTTDDGYDEQSPAGRAVRTRTSQVVDDLLTDPPFEPWREAALSRGYRSGISLPLVYRDALYGVLNIYATEPGVFDDLERQTLEELSDVIAHASNALASKQALVSDAVVELELGFDVDAVEDPLFEFVRADPDRSFELDAVVPGADGGYRAIVSFTGATPEEVTSLGGRAPTVEGSRVIADRDGTLTAEAVLDEGNLLFWLVDRGAVPRSFVIDGSEADIVVELAGDADVREFVEQLEDAFAPVELLGRSDRERPVRTPAGFLATLEGHLTQRQREVIETAYFSGYFESPRRRTGAEVAESLGISQPTFSNHLRSGLRNLFGLLYDTDGPEDSDPESLQH